MEEEGNSHSSLGPVTPTSHEMMKAKRILKVEAEYSEICFEKIKSVLEKLEETGGITSTVYNKRDGTVTVSGYFDPEKLKMELQNEAGDAIKSITYKPNGFMATDYVEPEWGFSYTSFPEMRVPEAADSRTEILNHSELPMESRNYHSEKTKASNSSRWCCW